MLNFESCDLARQAADGLAGGRAQQWARRLAGGLDAEDTDRLKRLSRDFAGLMYGMLVKEMQEAIRENAAGESAFADGAQNLFTMFLPRALADSRNDPLSANIYDALTAFQDDGGRLDEQA